MFAVGIDYSLTCPAACLYSDEAPPQFWFAHESKTSCDVCLTADAILPGSVSQRAARTATFLMDWLFLHAPDVKSVAIEDYAFAATGRVFHIGENTGILKYFLDRQQITYRPHSPSAIKKYATGKGNADKPKMVRAFLETYPAARAWIAPFFPRTACVEYGVPKSPLSDLADAYWIARYEHSRQRSAL